MGLLMREKAQAAEVEGRTPGTTTETGKVPRPEAAHKRLLRRARNAQALRERSGAVRRRVRRNGVRNQGMLRLSGKVRRG
jgi:hypothetical protein